MSWQFNRFSQMQAITEKQRAIIQKKIDILQKIIAEKTDEFNKLNSLLILPIKQKKQKEQNNGN